MKKNWYFSAVLSPSTYYTEQKKHFNGLLSKNTKSINRISLLRLWSAIGAVAAGAWALHDGNGWLWCLAGVIAMLFLILVRIHTRLADAGQMIQTNIIIIDNELQALEGNYSAFADGAANIDTAHPYSYDLDLYGKGSIYQMLCRTTTIGGASVLAGRMASLTLVKENILMRQAIIKELSGMPEMLQGFRVAGVMAKEEKGDEARLRKWLQGEDSFTNNTVARIAGVVMPVLSIGCIVWSILSGGIYAGIVTVILVNWTLLGSFQKKIKIAAQQIGHTAPLIDKYEGLLKELALKDYTTQWLQETGTTAKTSLTAIAHLKKLVHLFDSRGNSMVWPLMNSLFLFDIYCLLRLETWRQKYKQAVLASINTVIVTDVYVSCAIYAFNNSGNTYPIISEAGSGIQAKELHHPLLSPKTAVSNDVSMGTEEQFYLLTGANMTGKSTFIRTIGVSNVLCNMGLPLPAKEVSLPLLGLYTAMRITDSVQDDISYFRAELNRIKAIMDKVSGGEQHYLVLLDEPLRGTNSTDKQQGTRAIIETLLTHHVTGIIATHDTGLCDLETNYKGKISNYHFESAVTANGLSFDFKLRRGCSTSNNATILMRQMGIVK